MTEMLVYTLSWDNDAGCGCDVFPSSELRDNSFREILLSFASPAFREGMTSTDNLLMIDLVKLVEMLDKADCLGGARFSCGSKLLRLSS